MKNSKSIAGKILYGLLFLGILPFLLCLWANYTDHIVRYPAIGSFLGGVILSAIGGILMIWGMLALMIYGKGLPMNPYPPRKLVKEGPYRLTKHPIYLGFGILLIGVSIFMNSASGLWLVAPVTILGMVALVWGHERIGLSQRYPDDKLKTYLDIPGKEEKRVNLRDRLSALFWVLLFFLMGNFIAGYLYGEVSSVPGESWNIHQVFEVKHMYFVSLLFFIGPALVLKRRESIREWTISILIALGLSLYISLLWPAAGVRYFPVEFESVTGGRMLDLMIMSIPLFLILLSLKAYMKIYKRFAALFIIVAIVPGMYQLVNSKSSVMHLVISVSIFLLAANYSWIWFILKNLSEKIANSWKEWAFGPIRIINHGFYVGFGAFFGITTAGWLAGKAYAWAILIFALVVIIFSAIWAQVIEGSEKLKRPFGYYGALVGIIFAGLIVWSMGYNVWIIIGVISVLMPWVQAIGRLRCLVNGCCHGSPIEDPNIGIRYFHHRSRVCSISSLKGELLHPTPLYAILWLFFIGFLLLKLWNSHLPYSFIFGLYLILTGIGRFVEEAYRGEVQTPVWNGLHLYQWTAIISVVIGIFMTVIPVPEDIVVPEFGWQILVAATLGGLFTFFAMGVDFPRSNTRFSRLI